MKYVKSFETTQNMPQVGDYVICIDYTFITKATRKFLENNIGKIISYYKGAANPYEVIFNNPPSKSIDFDSKGIRCFKREEILHFNKDKKKVEMLLIANKYNL